MRNIIRLICALSAIASILTTSCASVKVEETKEFKLDSYNGHFVESLAKAYETFQETDELPNSINVEGLSVNQAKYIAGAIILIDKILAEPDSWQESDIEIGKITAPSNADKSNTYTPDIISLEEIGYLSEKLTTFAQEKGYYPNYVTFPTKYVEVDGTEHDNKLCFNNVAVIYVRLFHEFVANKGVFPESVSTWQSDFLRKTNNCDIDSSVVLAARDAAIEGKTTVREKAEALFYYSRDEWDWINYANTRKGAVKTIQDKEGNCCDLSHALIAMTRAAGIPARYMHGQCLYSSGLIGHVFVEMYVDGEWYICDPSSNSNEFGTHNWAHMDTFNGRYKTLPF